MDGVNEVIFIGRVGRDPEVKAFASGSIASRFSIAVSESYKNDQGEKTETTEWVPCVCWDGIGKFAADYVKKGDLVYTRGRWKSREWQDKDGNKKKEVENIVKELRIFINVQRDRTREVSETDEVLPKAEGMGPVADDLPF
jgi:single-strand DNA-binding protein